jgi:hypothetical protein
MGMTERNDRRLRVCRAIMAINVLVVIVTLFVAAMPASVRGGLSGTNFKTPAPHGITDWPSHHQPLDPTV